MKYTISVTKEEYELIMTALDSYLSGLRQKITDQASTWLIKSTGDSGTIAVLRKTRKPRKSAKAPYGYKKDGTPKKRPGRAPKSEG